MNDRRNFYLSVSEIRSAIATEESAKLYLQRLLADAENQDKRAIAELEEEKEKHRVFAIKLAEWLDEWNKKLSGRNKQKRTLADYDMRCYHLLCNNKLRRSYGIFEYDPEWGWYAVPGPRSGSQRESFRLRCDRDY